MPQCFMKIEFCSKSMSKKLTSSQIVWSQVSFRSCKIVGDLYEDYFLVSALSFLGLNAHALEQCDSTSKSEVSYDSESIKITQVSGDLAMEFWRTLDVESTEVKPGTGDFGYNAKAKYSENLNCWNYQPRQYVNGVEVGPSNCEVYTCNVIERK